MSDTEKPISSPCISICALNEDDICTGCYRSVDEIRDWHEMDNKQRKDVLKKSMLLARKANPFL